MAGRRTYPRVRFDAESNYVKDLRKLPWESSITSWRSLGVKHLDIKRGVGRHPVVFVQVNGNVFVVKELGFDVAQKEISNYKMMLESGIHTLIPVGCVSREEAPLAVRTAIGTQLERNIVGHTVTLLVDRVLPDSQLFRRAFKMENRQRIWDAIVDLFVELHSNGVFWGDASLYNTLVKFIKVDIPHIGKRTRLKAFLADAETVEIRSSLSDSLRYADLNFFFESMEWINEDLRAEGAIRDELATERDKLYLRQNYDRLYEAAMRSKEFELRSSLNLKQYLGPVRQAGYLDLLEKHIEEHKWYLSEDHGEEVQFREAAQDWLRTIFIPVCELFKSDGILDFFPGKTASDLYVEVMTNKYYLSKEKGRDVGMVYAMRDYAQRFGREQRASKFWNRLAKKMVKIFGIREQALLGVA